jgi:hypothetical protein
MTSRFTYKSGFVCLPTLARTIPVMNKQLTTSSSMAIPAGPVVGTGGRGVGVAVGPDGVSVGVTLGSSVGLEVGVGETELPCRQMLKSSVRADRVVPSYE